MKNWHLVCHTKAVAAIQENIKAYDLGDIDFQFWVWGDRE